MKTEFKITYWFVDNTYWDDGNRTTSRSKIFKSLEEVTEFVNNVTKCGVTETSRVSNKTSKFRVDYSDFRIEKLTSEEIPWWVIVDNFDWVVLRMIDYLKQGRFNSLEELENKVVNHYNREKYRELYSKAKDTFAQEQVGNG